MESYCVKERKKTKRVEPSGYKTAKNGRLMFYCKCASCGITKTRFAKSSTTKTTTSKKNKKIKKAKKTVKLNPPALGGQFGGEMSLSDVGSYSGYVPKKLF